MEWSYAYPLMTKGYKPQIKSPLKLHSRAVPRVEAPNHISIPNTGRNSGGRQIKKKIQFVPAQERHRRELNRRGLELFPRIPSL